VEALHQQVFAMLRQKPGAYKKGISSRALRVIRAKKGLPRGRDVHPGMRPAQHLTVLIYSHLLELFALMANGRRQTLISRATEFGIIPGFE
jgi:hypothetical protein